MNAYYSVALLLASCDAPRQMSDILADLQTAEGAECQRLAVELRGHGKAAVGAWITLLAGKDYRLYVIAAGELGALGARATQAVPALVTRMRDGFPGKKQDEKMTAYDRVKHPDIGRTPAREALAKIGVPAVAAVVDLLDHHVGQTRQEATFTLGQIGAAAAPVLADVVARLADEDKAVAAAAAWAVGEIGTYDETVSKALQLALLDEHELVRFEGLKAVGKLGAKAVALRELVRKFLEDKESSVRKMAGEVLQRFPPEK